MEQIEKVKLINRAFKYKLRNDIGGIKYIQNSIKKKQTVFDVGAHKAGYLFWMHKSAGKSGKLVAFEPQSVLFQYLQKIKSIFDWNNVELVNKALSDVQGETTLFIPINKIEQESSPSATIIETVDKTTIQKTEKVSLQTLDHFCKEKNMQPDFIKIDVEGNELKVLQGGLNVISTFKPKILIEIESRHAGEQSVLATFTFFENLGYKGYFIKNSYYVPLSDFSFAKFQDINNKRNYCNNFIFQIEELAK